MKKLYLYLLAGIFFPTPSLAASISSSGVEMEYQYEVSFHSLSKVADAEPNAKELAKFHSSHVFGLFHSPKLAEDLADFPADLNEGFAGSKDPAISRAKAFIKPGDPYYWVSYLAKGEAIVLKRIIEAWGGKSKKLSVELPLVLDLPEIYKDELKSYQSPSIKKCTDSEYWKPYDFYYFYDPFRCPQLVKENTEFIFKKKGPWTSRKKFPSTEILGDNGNDELVVLYYAVGFDGKFKKSDKKSKIKRDDGYRIYSSVLKTFKEDFGFEEIGSRKTLERRLGGLMKHLKLKSPVSTENFAQKRLYKSLVLEQDEKTFVIRLGLFDSQGQSDSSNAKAFPQFWREAWTNADFVYYGGHSGDGIALNEGQLLRTLGSSILIPQKSQSKLQVGFLDACSTYAYYQDMYRKMHPGLHLMTYGVVSLYHAAEASMEVMTEVILSGESIRWDHLLREIEEAQLEPHYKYLYGSKDGAEYAEENREYDLYPSFLLNVWVP